ncbi:hypothetical protein PIB30_055470, partial [Stylosanthes scabra]|nr:hypothetical protein [Stylosanthes scabra]
MSSATKKKTAMLVVRQMAPNGDLVSEGEADVAGSPVTKTWRFLIEILTGQGHIKKKKKSGWWRCEWQEKSEEEEMAAATVRHESLFDLRTMQMRISLNPQPTNSNEIQAFADSDRIRPPPRN